MFLGIDPLYWIMMLPILLLSMWASFRVKRSFDKFSKVPSHSGLRGVEVAQEILRNSGLN